jgi:hypothetical protein
MKSLTKLMTSGVFAYGVVFASEASAAASAGWGQNNTAPTGVPTELESTIMNIINYILGFITLIATLIIIYGGVLYLTSAGNEDQIGNAKKTIVYGVVGIIVCGLAYAMVTVVSTVLGGSGGGTAA